MTYEDIIYTEDPVTHVARIQFNRPTVHNAMALKSYGEIANAIDQAQDNDAIKVVVLSGAGPSFSSGQDLSEVGFMYGFGDGKEDRRRPSQRRRLVVDRKWADLLSTVTYCSKITIASVHGHCLGSGFDLALASDIIIAAEDANLGHPGRRLVGPGLGFNTPMWFWRLGPSLAKYMAITGETLSGEEAQQRGFVMKAVPAADLVSETEQLALRIAKMPADGIVMGKASFRLAADVAGIGMGYSYGYIMHTLGTNIRYEEDEHNFFKARRDEGVHEAFVERDKRFTETDS